MIKMLLCLTMLISMLLNSSEATKTFSSKLWKKEVNSEFKLTTENSRYLYIIDTNDKLFQVDKDDGAVLTSKFLQNTDFIEASNSCKY
jgi:hypothetical protein